MQKLFMLLIGCSPARRNTEQHDVFFGIGTNIKEVLNDAIAFWPEAANSFHLDAWREVTLVDGYSVTVNDIAVEAEDMQLFFINLGGYKKDEFEEFHYKMIVAAKNKNEAIKQSKQTAFFKHTGFKSATAHIDDKYGIDIDDISLVKDILPTAVKAKYKLVIKKAAAESPADKIYLGYFRPEMVHKWGLPNSTDY